MFAKRLHSLLLPLAVVTAFWPVWHWYVARLLDGSDEPWGIVALATAAIYVLCNAKSTVLRLDQLSYLALLLFVYLTTFWMLPDLLKGVLAVAALAILGSCALRARGMHLGLLGLLLLSLPLIATLQFYLGYPLRLVSTVMCAEILSIFGFPVDVMGTSLHWLGELIVVDAPCGGIKMLWVGLYLNFTLACFANLSTWHTWVSYSLSTGIIFLGNLLRITALFFVESGIVQAPDQVHVVVGLFSFLIVTILVWYLNAMLKGREVRHA